MADAPTARRESIVEGAAEVFLRYGFKKTSMDDLARAAGLSRQGLYLHFDTKEAIFKAAVLRLVTQLRESHEAALDRDDLDLDARLLGAFEAIHGTSVGAPRSEHLDELLATDASLAGPGVQDLEHRFIADVARILTEAGIAASWKRAGISARDLADNLYVASCGLKYAVKTHAAYRARMRTVIRIVTTCRWK